MGSFYACVPPYYFFTVGESVPPVFARTKGSPCGRAPAIAGERADGKPSPSATPPPLPRERLFYREDAVPYNLNGACSTGKDYVRTCSLASLREGGGPRSGGRSERAPLLSTYRIFCFATPSVLLRKPPRRLPLANSTPLAAGPHRREPWLACNFYSVRYVHSKPCRGRAPYLLRKLTTRNMGNTFHKRRVKNLPQKR